MSTEYPLIKTSAMDLSLCESSSTFSMDLFTHSDESCTVITRGLLPSDLTSMAMELLCIASYYDDPTAQSLVDQLDLYRGTSFVISPE